MELYQKTFQNKRRFTILDDKIFINTSTFTEDLEYYIKFDKLGFDIVRKKQKGSKTAFFILVAFDVMYAVLLVQSIATRDKMIYFWLGCLAFFVFITFATYANKSKSLIYLTGGHKVLELMGDKPDEHSVNDFIADIHDAMRAYYRSKYALVDLSLPKEYSVNQFKWLREIKAINEAEYQQLIERLETQYLL